MNRKEKIEAVRRDGGILDVMTAFQEEEGYLTKEAMEAIAESFGITVAQVYDTATFYAMLRTKKTGETDIQICHSAPCHVAGAREVVRAIEETLGIKAGETTADGKYSFSYCECVGQCASSPSVLINGKLYTGMTPEKMIRLIKNGGEE